MGVVSLYLIIFGIIFIIKEFCSERVTLADNERRAKLSKEFQDKYCDDELEEELRKFLDNPLNFEKAYKEIMDYKNRNGELFVFENTRCEYPQYTSWGLMESDIYKNMKQIWTNPRSTQKALNISREYIMSMLSPLMNSRGKLTRRQASNMIGLYVPGGDKPTTTQIEDWIRTPPWVSGNYKKYR